MNVMTKHIDTLAEDVRSSILLSSTLVSTSPPADVREQRFKTKEGLRSATWEVTRVLLRSQQNRLRLRRP